MKTGSEKSDKSGAQGIPPKNLGAGVNSNANTAANIKTPGYNLVRDAGDADKAETFKPKNLKHSPHSVSTSTGKATPKNKAGSANPFSPHSSNQKSLNSKEKERFPNSTSNKTSNYLQDEIKSKVFEETNFEDEALSDYTIRKKPATYKEQEITQQPKEPVVPEKIDHVRFGGHYPPPPPPSSLGSNQANNKPGHNFPVSPKNA